MNIDISTTLPMTEARKRIFKIADEVQKQGRYYTITERGKPKMVLISAREFESLLETIEALRDLPDLKRDMEEVDSDIDSGAYKNYTALESILFKEGFLVNDKGKIKYGLSNSLKKEGGKRTRKNSKRRKV
ncbi:hypothetical protein A2Y83_01410 [Candidatus Falkowbacteria bacterium RBG_13_39_14]|uniref:Antitoxin n=1 Tax=Candidatus Falkowbacteria bacterium RBG_13_39_14 TaxID=1797985 RepID=A0A1F5S9H2_9BACT|nr:MAG: hypothetical protein A2Y83_01410 [Candidatus Falkowbacteria bacterium RBG_13_39_14]